MTKAMKRRQNNLYMGGLLLIEAIIMLYAVPKANADEISMKISLVIALFLAILVSLALLVKGNQGNYKAITPIFIVCVATYIQILYCAAFNYFSILYDDDCMLVIEGKCSDKTRFQFFNRLYREICDTLENED